MQIHLNGEPRELTHALTVAELLVELGLEHVAVAVNMEVVPRSRRAERRLAPGDRVELIQAVGGG